MRFTSLILCIFTFLWSQLLLTAQIKVQKITITQGCNFADQVTLGEISVIGGSQEAQSIVSEILGTLPTITNKPSITLNAGPVANALATEQNGQRFIIYSEKFLEEFKAKSLTKWAAYCLMAHEIGHHVYRHQFGEKTREQSHKDELEADEFAAKVLAHLNVSLDELLSGIKTFDKDGGSDSHPDPGIREEVMAVAYKQELASINKNQGNSYNKFVLELDPSCYTNPWNLAKITNTQVELDEEKITIKVQIPSQYANKRLKVCLKTNDPNMTPNQRTSGAVSGTGIDLPYSPSINIVWNYTMDRYAQDQVSKPKMIRVYVYLMDAQPQEATVGKFVGASMSVIGIGTTTMGWAFRTESKQLYNREYLPDDKRTGDANFAKAQQAYEDANDKYIRSQYFVGIGAALAVTGTIMFIKATHKTKEARRSICYTNYRWNVEPLIAANGAIGAGLRLEF